MWRWCAFLLQPSLVLSFCPFRLLDQLNSFVQQLFTNQSSQFLPWAELPPHLLEIVVKHERKEDKPYHIAHGVFRDPRTGKGERHTFLHRDAVMLALLSLSLLLYAPPSPHLLCPPPPLTTPHLHPSLPLTSTLTTHLHPSPPPLTSPLTSTPHLHPSFYPSLPPLSTLTSTLTTPHLHPHYSSPPPLTSPLTSTLTTPHLHPHYSSLHPSPPPSLLLTSTPHLHPSPPPLTLTSFAATEHTCCRSMEKSQGEVGRKRFR